MGTINRQLTGDAANRPVAVEVDYADWLEIERRLELTEPVRQPDDLSRFAGKVPLDIDPLVYQRQIRGEWPE